MRKLAIVLFTVLVAACGSKKDAGAGKPAEGAASVRTTRTTSNAGSHLFEVELPDGAARPRGAEAWTWSDGGVSYALAVTLRKPPADEAALQGEGLTGKDGRFVGAGADAAGAHATVLVRLADGDLQCKATATGTAPAGGWDATASTLARLCGSLRVKGT